MQGSHVCGSSNANSGTHVTINDNSFNGVHEAQVNTNMKRKRSSNDDHEEEEVDGEYPVGYRFCPTDRELIYNYLNNKILNNPLPHNKIEPVDLYLHNPHELTQIYKPLGDREWYFFTPRNRKYPNGGRPSRSAGTGFWKATGADRHIVLDDKDNSLSESEKREIAIGHKKSLVFYEGKPPEGVKTNWIMHEYRVSASAKLPQHVRKDASDMKLDDWVLCKIHSKSDGKVKVSEKEVIVPDDQHTVEKNNDHHDEYSAESVNPDSKKSRPLENFDGIKINADEHHYLSNNNTGFELPPLLPSEDYSNCYSSHYHHHQLPMLPYGNNNNNIKYMMNLPQPKSGGEFGIFQDQEHGLQDFSGHLYMNIDSQLYHEMMQHAPYHDAAQHQHQGNVAQHQGNGVQHQGNVAQHQGNVNQHQHQDNIGQYHQQGQYCSTSSTS